MGAINNAFNQALGAVAGAGLAIKHAKESDLSKAVTAEHSALVAKNQAVDAEAAADEAKKGEEQARSEQTDAVIGSFGKDEEYYAAEEEYHNKMQKGQKASYDTVYKKFTEWEAAKKAITEASNKIKSIEAIKQRAVDQRAYADKASQIASKAQQRYQSKWGGR